MLPRSPDTYKIPRRGNQVDITSLISLTLSITKTDTHTHTHTHAHTQHTRTHRHSHTHTTHTRSHTHIHTHTTHTHTHTHTHTQTVKGYFAPDLSTLCCACKTATFCSKIFTTTCQAHEIWLSCPTCVCCKVATVRVYCHLYLYLKVYTSCC